MLLSDFCESSEKQNGGAPVYIGDATFFVKRLGTAEANKVIRDATVMIYGIMHKRSDIDDNLVYAHVLADYAVTGWSDVMTTEHEEYKYSPAAARKLFLNPEYHLSLNQLIINEAYKFENYLHDEAEEDLEAIKKP